MPYAKPRNTSRSTRTYMQILGDSHSLFREAEYRFTNYDTTPRPRPSAILQASIDDILDSREQRDAPATPTLMRTARRRAVQHAYSTPTHRSRHAPRSTTDSAQRSQTLKTNGLERSRHGSDLAHADTPLGRSAPARAARSRRSRTQRTTLAHLSSSRATFALSRFPHISYVLTLRASALYFTLPQHLVCVLGP